MATRFIKDSIWTSPNLNSLSDLAENFFFRLLPLPDDHGCCEITPAVIKGRCYPLKDNVTAKKIEQWAIELVKTDLIRVWEVNRRIYAYFPTWSVHQRIRSLNTRKTPEPPESVVNCRQSESVDASCGSLFSLLSSLFTHLSSLSLSCATELRECEQEVFLKSETTTPNEQGVEASDSCAEPEVTVRAKTSAKGFSAVQEARFTEFWAAYPKRKNRGDAEKAWLQLKPDEQLFAKLLQGLERAKTSADWQKECGQFIPYPASWLRGRRWEDEDDPKTGGGGYSLEALERYRKEKYGNEALSGSVENTH
jgi:hypothetical protein